MSGYFDFRHVESEFGEKFGLVVDVGGKEEEGGRAEEEGLLEGEVGKDGDLGKYAGNATAAAAVFCGSFSGSLVGRRGFKEGFLQLYQRRKDRGEGEKHDKDKEDPLKDPIWFVVVG